MTPTVLVVAGSDPLAYAGLEADMRHLQALRCPAIGVVSAWTRQSSRRLLEVRSADVSTVIDGVRAALSAGGVAAVKVGMLHRVEVVKALAEELRCLDAPIVLDPVIQASGGGVLLDEIGCRRLLERLVPLASLVTPNLVELELLGGSPEALLRRGAGAVLVKGGHAEGPRVVDTLHTSEGRAHLEDERIEGVHPRGTGCAVATAAAAALARGADIHAAVEQAVRRVRRGIARCADLGTSFLVLD